MIQRLLTGLFCCLVLSATADARPLSTTKYTYYAISGNTAGEIYNAMLRRGPHVNGAKAYAATSATSWLNGKLIQAKSCVIENYRLKIDFVIRLPRIKNEKALTGTDRSRWRQFAQFLKRHEETHRSIWLGCAQELETQVRAIRAAACNTAETRAIKLWDTMRKSCTRKHDAFDAAEQYRLMQHPFVKLVLAKKTRTARAAKAP